MTGRASKRKGSAEERAIVKFFGSLGWKAKRVPLSGGADGFPGDVYAYDPAGRKYRIESKRRASGDGFKTLVAALKAAKLIETLKGEGWQFFQRTGPYKEYATHAAAYPAFTDRVEGILGRTWRSSSPRSPGRERRRRAARQGLERRPLQMEPCGLAKTRMGVIHG